MKKKLVIPGLALVLLMGIGSQAVGKVYAEEGTQAFPPMIQGLIERFNLNEEEVRNYLTEQRDARRAEMAKAFEDKLSKAVSEGKITEEQKNALLEKMEENIANGENVQNLTREEREAQRQAHREEMQKWAEEQGIDLDGLGLGPQGPEGRGHGPGKFQSDR